MDINTLIKSAMYLSNKSKSKSKIEIFFINFIKDCCIFLKNFGQFYLWSNIQCNIQWSDESKNANLAK